MSEKTIGNKYSFDFNDLIGKGNYGIVFKGKDITKNSPVAIKLLIFNGNSNDKESLQNEIDIMKQLVHKNIVQLYDVIQIEDKIYLIEEFMEGGDLNTYMQKNRHLPEDKVIKIFKDILSGFQELVKQGIVHRDLKPANVLCSNGAWKLTDFGFAKTLQNFRKDMLTSYIGTPLYMSPQILANQAYTSKTDIWSIGFLFYEVLFGKTPWTGQSECELLNNIKTKPLQVPQGMSYALITNAAKKLINDCLQAEEQKRIGWDQLFMHEIFHDCFHYEKRQNELENRTKYILDQLIPGKWEELNAFISSSTLTPNELKFEEFKRILEFIDPSINREQCEYIFNKFALPEKNIFSFQQFQQHINRVLKVRNSSPFEEIVLNTHSKLDSIKVILKENLQERVAKYQTYRTNQETILLTSPLKTPQPQNEIITKYFQRYNNAYKQSSQIKQNNTDLKHYHNKEKQTSIPRISTKQIENLSGRQSRKSKSKEKDYYGTNCTNQINFNTVNLCQNTQQPVAIQKYNKCASLIQTQPVLEKRKKSHDISYQNMKINEHCGALSPTTKLNQFNNKVYLQNNKEKVIRANNFTENCICNQPSSSQTRKYYDRQIKGIAQGCNLQNDYQNINARQLEPNCIFSPNKYIKPQAQYIPLKLNKNYHQGVTRQTKLASNYNSYFKPKMNLPIEKALFEQVTFNFITVLNRNSEYIVPYNQTTLTQFHSKILNFIKY